MDSPALLVSFYHKFILFWLIYDDFLKSCYNVYVKCEVIKLKVGISRVKSPDKFDFVFIGILIAMALTSLACIYSAYGIIGETRGVDYLSKQLMWFAIGFAGMAFLKYLGNDSLYQVATYAYWFLLACLAYILLSKYLTDFIGISLPFVHKANGAACWFLLPGIGTLQPSEFMKVVLLLICANVIDEHNKANPIGSFMSDIELFASILKWALPPIILIFLQPDTGVVIIIGISLIVMILCSGIKREWVLFFAIFAIVVLIIFFFLYFFHFDFLNDLIGGEGGYKMKRITSWLNPESDIAGDGMQLYTALLVIGSAGFSGHGIQQSLVHIPEAQTDFIFAVAAQSWGFIGSIAIVVLCAILDIYIARIAYQTKNMYEKYFILGILGMLLYQQIQNIGMIIGLLPITGITLPLISCGGSSLLSYFAAFGIIMNTSAKNQSNSDFMYE